MSDTVQLEIESGRCKKKTASERICKFCYLNTVGDEVPFYEFFLLTIMKGNAFLVYCWQSSFFQNSR